jgi:branched-chain amino acid transport system permease protein
MGIDVFRYKLTAFFISSVFAGVAGSLWANYLGLITPEQFPLMDAIWFLGMIIVGGMGSIVGTIFGVILLKGLSEMVILLGPMLGTIAPSLGGRTTAAMAQIFFGVVIIVFLIFEPRGLAHRWELWKTSFRKWPFIY